MKGRRRTRFTMVSAIVAVSDHTFFKIETARDWSFCACLADSAGVERRAGWCAAQYGEVPVFWRLPGLLVEDL
jgi:hypothetical protein